MKTGLSTKTALLSAVMLFYLCITTICPVIAKQDIPEVISLAGMTLHISPEVRRQIGAHVDLLIAQKRPSKSNIQSLQAYFSLISEILDKNGLPLDYKYLAFSENYLWVQPALPNNKGFWELEVNQAQEIGLEINDKVDERFNLVTSTELTANYLKKSNLYFKNWAFAMLTLELGFHKAKTYMLSQYQRSAVIGAQHLSIDENTHPYIRKFIAQKLAFENLLSPENQFQYKLIRYNEGANMTLPQIARKFQVSPEEIRQHNPWLKKKRIPANKIYPVLIPKPELHQKPDSKKQHSFAKTDPSNGELESNPKKDFTTYVNDYQYKKRVEELQEQLIIQEKEYDAKNSGRKLPGSTPTVRPVEELPRTHTVLANQTLIEIAQYYGVSITYLRQINNLRSDEDVFEGQMILIKPIQIPSPSSPSVPENNAESDVSQRQVHIVAPGEELDDIARKYNVSVSSIRLKNHIRAGETLQVGQKLIIRESSQNHYNLKTASPESDDPQPESNNLPQKHEGARLREKLLDYTPGIMRKMPDQTKSPLDKLSDTKKISMYFRR